MTTLETPIPRFAALVALLCGCFGSSTPQASDEPIAQAQAATQPNEPSCRDGKIVPCSCAAGKGYQLCTDGSLGACVCERPGAIKALTTDDVRPPIATDLALYIRDLKGAGDLMAEFQTSMGNIRCKLHEHETPMTVANFVGLARGLKAWVHPDTKQVTMDRLYNGTTFHRVIPNFMIQGGDPLGTGMGRPGYSFDDEVMPSLRHDRPGILATANQGPNTNGCQFFITEKAAPWLDDRNTIFGQCEDLAVIKQIARAQLDPSHRRVHRPKDPIVIKRVRIFRR